MTDAPEGSTPPSDEDLAAIGDKDAIFEVQEGWEPRYGKHTTLNPVQGDDGSPKLAPGKVRDADPGHGWRGVRATGSGDIQPMLIRTERGEELDLTRLPDGDPDTAALLASAQTFGPIGTYVSFEAGSLDQQGLGLPIFQLGGFKRDRKSVV